MKKVLVTGADGFIGSHLTESFYRSFNLPVSIVRPFNTFGPRQSARAVIPTIISQLLAGKDKIELGALTPTRDFNYVKDTAAGFIAIAESDKTIGEEINIATQREISIGDLAKAVQQLFGDTGTNIIGTRHGEKLYETLMTREERLRSEDMGQYFRVAADSRDLNYDKFVVQGQVHTQADESYTSHNTTRLDVEGTVKKLLTTDYVREELDGIRHL